MAPAKSMLIIVRHIYWVKKLLTTNDHVLREIKKQPHNKGRIHGNHSTNQNRKKVLMRQWISKKQKKTPHTHKKSYRTVNIAFRRNTSMKYFCWLSFNFRFWGFISRTNGNYRYGYGRYTAGAARTTTTTAATQRWVRCSNT